MNTQETLKLSDAASDIREVVSSLLWGGGMTIAAGPIALVFVSCGS